MDVLKGWQGRVLMAGLLGVAMAAAFLSGAGNAAEEAKADPDLDNESSPVTKVDSGVGEAEHSEAAEEVVANCRYGASSEKGTDLFRWIDDLGAGWWLDFNVNYETPAENGAEYVHIIWAEQNRNGQGDYLNSYSTVPDMGNNSLGYLIEKRQGRLWIVGNEVDRGPDPGQIFGGQGDTMPDMYARIYHDVYHYIKQWDPTALVSPSALVEVTPGRIQYLDLVVEKYQQLYGTPMPVDVWNMHLYILPEIQTNGTPSFFANVALGTDPGLAIKEADGDVGVCGQDDVYCLKEHDDTTVFVEQVVRMRTWMEENGYQEKPLILTEYSLLLPYEVDGETCHVEDEEGNCFTPSRVKAFADATFNYLETAADPALGYVHDNWRLVQQWIWFGIYRDGLGSTSNLAQSDMDPLMLTPTGKSFYTATRAISPTLNLLATQASDALAIIGDDGQAEGVLAAAMRNNGNRRIEAPFTVTFYSDEALTEVIGEVVVPAPDEDFVGVTGCSVREWWATADLAWSPAPEPGTYPYWAVVDDGDTIDETDENDNVTSGEIEFVAAGEHVYLPALVK